MANKKKPTRGIRVTDLWKKKGARRGRHFMFDVWDPKVRKYKSKCFDDHQVGMDWAEHMQALFRTGVESAATVRLADVGPMYVEALEAGERTPEHIGHCRRTVEEAVAAGVNDLTDPAIADKAARWLATRKSRRPGQQKATKMAPRTRNGYLRTLRAIANYAMKRRLMTYNPFLAIELVKEPNNARPVYSLDELRLLTADEHRDKPMWIFAVLAVYTGMRSTEIAEARWSWIDWGGEILHLPADKSKNRTYRQILVQPELAAILKPMAGVGSRRICGIDWNKNVADQATREFLEYLADLGIIRTGRIIHDVRHSCASLLTATGYPERLVMDAMGHKDRRTSDQYSRGAIKYYKQVKHWPKGEIRLKAADGQATNPQQAATS